jgi:hypothetical protein
MTEQPFEYYLNLIKNGEVLTDIEISNAKKLLRRGCNKDLEKIDTRVEIGMIGSTIDFLEHLMKR